MQFSAALGWVAFTSSHQGHAMLVPVHTLLKSAYSYRATVSLQLLTHSSILVGNVAEVKPGMDLDKHVRTVESCLLIMPR